MRKNALFLVFSVMMFSKCSFAQAVFGENLYQKSSKPSYFILSNQDDRDVVNDLKNFVKPFYGKISETGKNTYRIEKLKDAGLPDEINAVDVTVESTKKVLKLAFFFLDKSGAFINVANAQAEEKFVNSFANFSQNSLLQKLMENQVKVNQDNLDDANKAVSKLEKKINNNLDDQDKLGKKLDESPDMLAKALSAKQELLDKSAADSTAALSSDIQKASHKKEKEIAKIQKETERANSKLDKKTKELDDLKTELQASKVNLAEIQKIYNKSVENLNALKK